MLCFLFKKTETLLLRYALLLRKIKNFKYQYTQKYTDMVEFGEKLKGIPRLKKGYTIGIAVIVVVVVVVFFMRGSIFGFTIKERNPQCSDGIDNDIDGSIDYKYDGNAKKIIGDIDCTSLKDDSEAKECPGVDEICNGLDDDCDGFVDEGVCPFCGNNEIDSGEECDGTELNGKECSDFESFNIGELKCRDCKFDTISCKEIVCGNSIIDPGEECDGTNWGAIKGCSDLGFTGGTLKCIDCKFDKRLCASTKPDSCNDYDGGKEYEESGWIVGVLNDLEYNLTDKCITDEKLKEYYCDGKERKSEYYECPDLGNNETIYVCEDGACIQG